MTTRHIERLKASVYYGRPTPGWVVLVNGNPTHFGTATAKADSLAFAAKVNGK